MHAHLQASTMPARRSRISFSKLPSLIHLAHHRREERSQCVLVVSAHQEAFVCSLECGAGESTRGHGEWTLSTLNLNALVCKHLCVIFARSASRHAIEPGLRLAALHYPERSS